MRNLPLCLLVVLLAGCGVPSFLITPVKNTNVLQEVDAQPGKGWKQGKIAMIEVEGMLMNAKSGANAEAIKSGPLKDMGSPFKHLTPEERAVMQGIVDEYYARFIQVVTEHRAIKDPAALKLTTDGRVFSGQRAQELGLVDDV